MKKIFYFILLLQLYSCGPWPEPVGTAQTFNKPTQGCNQDVSVTFKNKYDHLLYIYYIEVPPGSSYKCEDLNYFGSFESEGTKGITVHKGQIMNLIFASDRQGKCSSGSRVLDTWIDCTFATQGKAFFDVKP